HRLPPPGQRPDDAPELLQGLALAVDHLRKAEAHAAVGVDGGVAQLGEGEIGEGPHRLVHRGAPLADSSQQPSQPIGIHVPSLSGPRARPAADGALPRRGGPGAGPRAGRRRSPPPAPTPLSRGGTSGPPSPRARRRPVAPSGGRAAQSSSPPRPAPH